MRAGRAEIVDVLPEDDTTVRGHLYAGGGSSLFHRDILIRYVQGRDAYHPFYWEDVEWGLRAWRDGYEVLYCPASRAWHRHRATISRFYRDDEVDRVVRRNAQVFQLRNFWESLTPEHWVARIANLDSESLREVWNPRSFLRTRLHFHSASCQAAEWRHLRLRIYP